MPPSFSTFLPADPGSFHLEEVQGSPAGGHGAQDYAGPCTVGNGDARPGMAGAVQASPAHLVVLKESQKPGGHEVPERFQNPFKS